MKVIPNIQPFINFKAKAPDDISNVPYKSDSFAYNNDRDDFVLSIYGTKNFLLNNWSRSFCEIGGVSPSHLKLVAKVFDKAFCDRDVLAHGIVVTDGESSPEDFLYELKREFGFCISSLTNEDVKKYLKHVDDYKVSKSDANLFEQNPFLMLLDKEQLERIKPFSQVRHFSRAALQLAQFDNSKLCNFKRLNTICNKDVALSRLNLDAGHLIQILNSDFKTTDLLDNLRFISNAHENIPLIRIKGFSNTESSCAIRLAAMDGTSKNRVHSLFEINSNLPYEKRFSLDDIEHYSNCSKEDYNKFLNLVRLCESKDRSLSKSQLRYLSQLDDTTFLRTRNILSREFVFADEPGGKKFFLRPEDAMLLARLPKDKASSIVDLLPYIKFSQLDTLIYAKCGSEPEKMTFSSKNKCYKDILDITAALHKNGISDKDINSFEHELIRAFCGEDVCVSVSRQNIKNLFLDFLSNIPSDCNSNLSKAEKTLRNSKDILIDCAKEGIPLEYSRYEFMQDLSNVLANCDPLKKDDILSKLNIQVSSINGEITAYNGILALNKLDLNNPVDKKVYELGYKFMYSNRFVCEDENINKLMSSITGAFPEFFNSIGKKQNPTHKFSNDIHTLLVLSHCFSNPLYSELTPIDKTCLKLAALFHDIGKADGVIDKGHQNTSAMYVKSILSKLPFSDEVKDRVFELVKNHHWFEEYNTGKKNAREIAFMFRRPNDFKIAKIMADADLKAVGSAHFVNYLQKFHSDFLKPVEDNIKYYRSTGNAAYGSYVVDINSVPLEKSQKDGRTYRVLHVDKFLPNEDLSKYGFVPGTKKDDLRFLVHMVSSPDKLESLKYLTDAYNPGILSESLISANFKRTYGNKKFGIVLSNRPYDVLEMSKSDIASGREKTLEKYIKTHDFKNDVFRTDFKHRLLKKLNISFISDDEYARFYENVIANKTSLDMFNKDAKYKIADKIISGKQLVEVLSEVMEDYIVKSDNNSNNEFVVFCPKIKGIILKTNSLDEAPDFIRDFAFDNNLAVYILGSDKN